MHSFYSQPHVIRHAGIVAQDIMSDILQRPLLSDLFGTTEFPNLPKTSLKLEIDGGASIAEYSFIGDEIIFSIPHIVGDPFGRTPPAAHELLISTAIHEGTHRQQLKDPIVFSMLGGEQGKSNIHAAIHTTLVMELDAPARTVWRAEEMRRKGDSRLSDFYMANGNSLDFGCQAGHWYAQAAKSDPEGHENGRILFVLVNQLLKGGNSAVPHHYISKILVHRMAFLTLVDGALDDMTLREGTPIKESEIEWLIKPPRFVAESLRPAFLRLGTLPNGANYFADPQSGSMDWIVDQNFAPRFFTDAHKKILLHMDQVTEKAKRGLVKLPSTGLQNLNGPK